MLPEWVGWFALASLVACFGWLTWWLLLSPLATHGRRANGSDASQTRLLVALLVVLSGVLFTAGARWDELWHRTYGGFGNDFLWPPHMLIYGGLTLNAAFAGWGLGRTLRGRGGLRERFRAEPLIGFLGLVAAYQVASIPSDLIWHVIIGPDITAWSLPHVLLAVTVTTIFLAGMGLAVSDAGAAGVWRSGQWPGRHDIVVIALASLGMLALLQLGVTEWEWPDDGGPGSAAARRPGWAYATVVLAVGVAEAHLAAYATRWVGAAILAALGALVGQALTIAFDRLGGMSGPMLASYLLVVPPAIALDLAPHSLFVGAGIYAVTFFVSLWLSQSLGWLPPNQPGLTLEVVVVGGVVALILGPMLATIASWLREPRVSPLRASSP